MSPLAQSPNLLALVFPRNSIDDVRHSFSSWDSCMQKSYCKWPVVAAIIVGGLIALSVLLCLIRFCCCGVECCCFCCSCLNSCCPTPKKRKKEKSSYTPPPVYAAANPYNYQTPMNYGFSPQPPVQAPQFATFESPSKPAVKEDALPMMPSWETASTRKVEDTSYVPPADVPEKDTHAGGQTGIPLDNMTSDGKRMKDDDTMYEDPDDQRQPMLRHAQNPQDQGYNSGYGFNDTDSHHGYADSHAGSTAGRDPQHPYGSYAQQQDNFSSYGRDQRSPTGTYSSGYPPTYQSRAPSMDQQRGVRDPYGGGYQQSPRAGGFKQDSYQGGYRQNSYDQSGHGGSYNNQPYGQRTMSPLSIRSPGPGGRGPPSNYAPSQSTVYEPPTELPGSLSVGAGPRGPGPRPSPYPHEMGGPDNYGRRPSGPHGAY